MKRVLTIGGSDPFAGGGIQTDLKTFENYHLFGLSALTSIGVLAISGEFTLEGISPSLLEHQLDSIQQMTTLDGIKLGFLHSVESIQIVGEFLKNKKQLPIVLDPVFAFKETRSTSNQQYIEALIQYVFPYASIITPNLREASLLIGKPIHSENEMLQAAKMIDESGVSAVVIKGGANLPGPVAADLFFDGATIKIYRKPQLNRATVNGAGCAFASAITANLVLGTSLTEAIDKSKEYVHQSIINGVPMADGSGSVWFGNYQGGKTSD